LGAVRRHPLRFPGQRGRRAPQLLILPRGIRIHRLHFRVVLVCSWIHRCS
jgi:hypothetical protein